MYKVVFSCPLGLFLLTALLSCAGAPSSRSAPSSPPPQWLDSASAVYPEDQYISAVGSGIDRESAEKNALGSLVAIFGQTVQGEIAASYRYSEAVSGGVLNMRENSEIESAVKTSFAMDTLVGAEIKERWFDGQSTHYAAAVMERGRGSLLYRNLIESNQALIQKLTALPEQDLYSFDGYVRYNLAADVADANRLFTNVLSVLRPAAAALTETPSGEEFRLRAREISGALPIMVSVDQDQAGRISAAFGDVLTAAGFRTGGRNARYVLAVSVSFSEVELPQNQNKFCRYVVDAKLLDTSTDQVLFPYNVNGREGHKTFSEAEARALRAAETRIRESFSGELKAYLSKLAPKLE